MVKEQRKVELITISILFTIHFKIIASWNHMKLIEESNGKVKNIYYRKVLCIIACFCKLWRNVSRRNSTCALNKPQYFSISKVKITMFLSIKLGLYLFLIHLPFSEICTLSLSHTHTHTNSELEEVVSDRLQYKMFIKCVILSWDLGESMQYIWGWTTHLFSLLHPILYGL